MKFITESGTEYEFDPMEQRVRRVGGDELRRDDEWLTLFTPPIIRIGKPVTMLLEPLGGGNVTVRTTTRVTRVGQ